MDVMYWTFEGLAGVWSVKAGDSQSVVDADGFDLPVQRWDNPNTPIIYGPEGYLIPGMRYIQAKEIAGAKKYDSDKPMMSLLMDGCPDALYAVGEVLTYGFKKYGGKHGWKALPDARERYESAMVRHQLALASGEVNDPESGLPHSAHIACNALFLLQFHKEAK